MQLGPAQGDKPVMSMRNRDTVYMYSTVLEAAAACRLMEDWELGIRVGIPSTVLGPMLDQSSLMKPTCTCPGALSAPLITVAEPSTN